MSTDVLRDRAAELITLFGSVREAAGDYAYAIRAKPSKEHS